MVSLSLQLSTTTTLKQKASPQWLRTWASPASLKHNRAPLAKTKQQSAENASFVEEDVIKPSLNAAPAKNTEPTALLRIRHAHPVLVLKAPKTHGGNAKRAENLESNASTKVQASDAQPVTSRNKNAWTKYDLFGEVFEDAMLNHRRTSVGLALIIEAFAMGRSQPVEIARSTGIVASRGEQREFHRYR